jgi:hypothetical protein
MSLKYQQVGPNSFWRGVICVLFYTDLTPVSRVLEQVRAVYVFASFITVYALE